MPLGRRLKALSALASASIRGVSAGSSFWPIATCNSSNAARADLILFAVLSEVRMTSPCASESCSIMSAARAWTFWPSVSSAFNPPMPIFAACAFTAASDSSTPTARSGSASPIRPDRIFCWATSLERFLKLARSCVSSVRVLDSPTDSCGASWFFRMS